MADISREEMGLIIGLVIGTLVLALLAVIAYILYDKRKEKLFAIFRFSGPQDEHRMPPPGGGGGQNWTTINNSMIGLEIHSNMYGGNCGQEGDQHHTAQEGGNGVLTDADRKSCLTVLFDWDPRKPLPPPFRTFEGLGAHHHHEDEGSAGSLPIRADYPPSPVRGEVQVTLAPADEVPPRPDGGAVAAGAPARDPIVSLRLQPEPDVPAVAGAVGASDGSVVNRTGLPVVSMRLDPGLGPDPSQSFGRGSVQGRPRSAASSEGGAAQQAQAQVSSVSTARGPAAEPRGWPTGSATPPDGSAHAAQPPAAEGSASPPARGPAPSRPSPEDSVLGGGAVALAADATVSISRSQGSSGSAPPPALLGDAEAHIGSAEGSKVLSSVGAGSPTARSAASGGCAGSPIEKDKSSGRLDLRCLVGFAASGAVGAS